MRKNTQTINLRSSHVVLYVSARYCMFNRKSVVRWLWLPNPCSPLSICLLSVCLFVLLSVCLSVCLSDCLSRLFLSVFCPSYVCPAVYLSVWLSVCRYLCLSVCRYVFTAYVEVFSTDRLVRAYLFMTDLVISSFPLISSQRFSSQHSWLKMSLALGSRIGASTIKEDYCSNLSSAS